MWIKTLQLLTFSIASTISQICNPTVTTASGTKAPKNFCSGQLIFEDHFDDFDFSTWSHEIFMGGPVNWEFQVYVNSRDNSFVEDGNLHIRPRLTSDYYEKNFLSNGLFDLSSNCTHVDKIRCYRQATPDNIISPIRSARIRTRNAFAFKYGVLEVRAKMPLGDWLWPAVWLVPSRSVYGPWPMSGEIDLIEARSNKNLLSRKTNVGSAQIESTLHFGPSSKFNGWKTAHFVKNSKANPPFNEEFHVYKLIWTPDSIQFYVDDEIIGKVEAGKGFWSRGNFQKSGLPNPWKISDSLMAPFDQEFFIIINTAVGGTSFFSDGLKNKPGAKPWSNDSPTATKDFWLGVKNWLPTWNYNKTDDADLQVDYLRVWAL